MHDTRSVVEFHHSGILQHPPGLRSPGARYTRSGFYVCTRLPALYELSSAQRSTSTQLWIVPRQTHHRAWNSGMRLRLPEVLQYFELLSWYFLFTHWFDSRNAAIRSAAVIAYTQAIVIIDWTIVAATTRQNHTVVLVITVKLSLSVGCTLITAVCKFGVNERAHVWFSAAFTRLRVGHWQVPLSDR